MLQLEHGDILYLGQEGRSWKYGFVVDISCIRQSKTEVSISPSHPRKALYLTLLYVGTLEGVMRSWNIPESCTAHFYYSEEPSSGQAVLLTVRCYDQAGTEQKGVILESQLQAPKRLRTNKNCGEDCVSPQAPSVAQAPTDKQQSVSSVGVFQGHVFVFWTKTFMQPLILRYMPFLLVCCLRQCLHMHMPPNATL